MSVQLQVGDSKTAAFNNRKTGEPIAVDGNATWESSDPAVLAVTPSEDGLTCGISAAGAGTATLSVKFDGDLGDGVDELTGSLEVTVVAPPERPEVQITVQ